MHCLRVKWMTAICLSTSLPRKKNIILCIILWLTVCCFQRQQTFKTLDGSVLEGEELDFPKILYCWSSEWKNPQLHLSSFIGLDFHWETQQPINHTFTHYFSPSGQAVLSKSFVPFISHPPPQIFLMPHIKLHGLAFAVQYSSFWANVFDFHLLWLSAPASSPLSCVKHPNELCVCVGI